MSGHGCHPSGCYKQGGQGGPAYHGGCAHYDFRRQGGTTTFDDFERHNGYAFHVLLGAVDDCGGSSSCQQKPWQEPQHHRPLPPPPQWLPLHRPKELWSQEEHRQQGAQQHCLPLPLPLPPPPQWPGRKTQKAKSCTQVPTTIDAAAAAKKKNTEMKEKNPSNLLRRSSSSLSATTTGCRGDPRMRRAVEARLSRPSASLLDALVDGGFVFLNLGEPNTSDRTVRDEDGVSLYQRKNQLSRRLRKAGGMSGRTSTKQEDPSLGEESGEGKGEGEEEQEQEHVDKKNMDASTHRLPSTTNDRNTQEVIATNEFLHLPLSSSCAASATLHPEGDTSSGSSVAANADASDSSMDTSFLSPTDDGINDDILEAALLLIGADDDKQQRPFPNEPDEVDCLATIPSLSSCSHNNDANAPYGTSVGPGKDSCWGEMAVCAIPI